MKPINFDDIRMKGDLAVRAGLNFTRLEGQWYRPDEVFTADSHGWPGDWEGRVILGLTLLAKSTHRTPAYLDEIVSLLPEHLNRLGYLGPILPEGKFDEQQFASHSWLIRGLIEYYSYQNDENVKLTIETLVRNFLLSSKGFYSSYPIEPRKRFDQQGTWILSKLQTKTKHHAETSDAGCLFIILDGATAAYEFLGWPELKELIEEIIGRFGEMDLQGLNIQTHATLSAIRGILRYFELTQDKKYLSMAENTFELYKKVAWTDAYGNYNWFGVPRWTESCAIIDSYIVSVQLWMHTRKPAYLNDAHLIFFNAMCYANRVNGSFGTDVCCGAKDAEDRLFLAPVNFETYWCCTMRGGEGFSRAIEYNIFTDSETDSMFLAFYNSCSSTIRFHDGFAVIEEITEYPYDGSVRLKVLESTVNTVKKLNFFIPDWADAETIELFVNGIRMSYTLRDGFLQAETLLKEGLTLELKFKMVPRTEEVRFENSVQGYHKFYFGPMLLGAKVEKEINSLDGNRFENYAESKYKSAGELSIPENTVIEKTGARRFEAKDRNITLYSFCDIKDMTKEDSMLQVLFRDEADA